MSVDLNTVRVEWSYPEHDLQLNDYYGLGGGAGWWFPNGGTSYSRLENPIAALDFTEAQGTPGEYMVFNTTGATGPVYSSWFVPNSGSFTLYIGRTSSSPTVTVEVESADANGTILTPDYGVSSAVVTTTGWSKVGAVHNATGTVKQRIKITGVGTYAVRGVDANDLAFETNYYSYGEFGTTSGGSFSKPTESMRKWLYDVTSKVTSINIQRGCRPNPPVDQLEIGTAVIAFKGTVPDASSSFYGSRRQGARVRISAKVGTEWKPIFTGRLQKTSVYIKADKSTWTEWLVEDRVADVARANAPGIRGTALTERLESVLNPTVAYDPSSQTNTANTSIRVLGATHVMYDGGETYAYQQSGNKLDYLLTLRNGDFGLLWCDKNNIMQYVSGGGGATVPEARGARTYTFVTGTKKTGEKSFLISGWDEDRTNPYTLTSVFVERLSGTTSIKREYGARHMAIRYGKRAADVAYISSTDNDNTLASNYINEYATLNPIDSFKWNATNDVTDAASIDIYDNLALWVDGASDNTGYPANTFGNNARWHRVIGLEHEIKPGSWVVTVTCRAKETTTKTGINVQALWF